MLLSNRFAKVIGMQPRFFTLLPPFSLGRSHHRNELLLIAIYIASVFLILCSSQIVVGDDFVLSDTLIEGSPEQAMALDQEWDCTESVAPFPFDTINSTGLSEVYEISTRHLSDRFRSINFERPNVEVNKWVGNRWSRSNFDEAMPAGGTGLLTIIYVHGNFMERNNSLERVRIVDRYLKTQTDRPYRLLMLSWPSQRGKKPLRDVVSNAESAECQSLYLAWMLQRLRNEPQISLLGFSFGARAVSGGLHLDAGGSIPGYSLSPNPNRSTAMNYRVGFVAPAIDRHWLERNGRHQLALTHVESMVNLYNSKDPVLRRFRFIDRLSQPIAAGFAGFTGIATLSDPRATSPLAGQSRIRQYDCGSVIGTTHAEKSYYAECPYFRNVIQHVLWKEPMEATCNAAVVP